MHVLRPAPAAPLTQRRLPHERRIEVVVGIVVVALGVPVLARLVVEVGIRKQPEADDAGWLAVVGADLHRVAASADLYAGISRVVRERVRRAVAIALIDPEKEVSRIGFSRLPEARLVDEPEVPESVVTAIVAQVLRRVALLRVRIVVPHLRMRRDRL